MPKTKRKRRRRRRSPPHRFRRFAFLLGATLLVALAAQALTWPPVSELAQTDPHSTAFLERAAKRLAAEGRPRPELRWVPRSAIAVELQHAVVASEDMNFFSHSGFDWGEMRVAVEETLSDGKRLRGASTLTQQLAKNLYLSPSRNPLRKVKEVLLTRQIEAQLSKHRILEIYLNVVEFGDGIYGVENAARHYWGSSASSLSRQQAVELAASLPSPRRWNPASASKTYRSRVRSLEQRVAESEWLRSQL
ncbi:MAG: monofunctional biosynthetic peptidoglycan transglycosylase [Acidobacteriota bacterium]